jgi:hypothetical protein
MADLGERVTKVAVAPTGGAIQKRQNIANELKPICALVEEMLEIAKRSYGVALTASHMGHIAYEHNVTILDLSSQLATLKRELSGWVMRSSQDATAAMILAEENVVMAKANQELRTQVQQLQASQRRQTEVFGLPTTVLNDAMPSGQTLLDLLDLPGHYSRLIGNLREPYANEQGRLSILSPTTLATRGDLIESIERQLSRPSEYDLNAANAYLNVAMSRASEAKRRGVAVYSAGRIPKRSIETIFRCELSGLRNNLPQYLKAPVPIASNLTMGLMDDLQTRDAIVFRDRFFDSKGHQIQDMQVSRDRLPATVLMANTMNASKELDDLLSQGDIPRLLSQELKKRKPLKHSVEPTHTKLPPSSSKEVSKQSLSSVAPPTPAVTNLGKRKDEHLNSSSHARRRRPPSIRSAGLSVGRFVARARWRSSVRHRR